MKKIKINKRVITIATYTIAILSAISFAIYPKTNAIFKKDNENALAYTSNLEMTYQGTFQPVLNEKDSTLNIARIRLTLPRDDRYNELLEKYVIKAVSSTPLNETTPETVCSIVPSTKSGNLFIAEDKDQTITFTNTENGVIEIECNVEANKLHNENIKVLIKFYEKVLDEEPFLFKQGTFSINYKEYSDKYKEPSADSVILLDKSTGDVYKEFMALIAKHIENSAYKQYIIGQDEENGIKMFYKYVNDDDKKNNNIANGIIESTAKTILLDSNGFELLGVTRTPAHDENGNIKGYGFEFDENFIGYVKTYSFYNSIYRKNSDFIFFSSDNADQIKIALKNSIETWAFNDINNTYTINNKEYNAKELVIKYIDEYIKNNNNLNYNIDGLNAIPSIEKSEEFDTKYPYIDLWPSIIDSAYNYLAKDEGKIIVSYYEHLSASSQTTYMEYVINNDIGKLTTNPYVSYLISVDFLNQSSELYQSVMCKEKDCKDLTEIYYDNNNKTYYQLNVIHHQNEKYNEINIKEFNSLEKALEGKHSDNIVNSFINNTEFNNAVTCTSNCETFTEMYYDAINNNYLLAKVAPNNTYHVNKISITQNTEFANIAKGILTDNVIAGIMANIKTEESLLNNAIKCKETCEIYNEVHYDVEKNNFIVVNITPNNTYKVNQINTESYSSSENSFVDVITNIYLSNLVKSLDISLQDVELNEIITNGISNPDFNSNYYEIHYVDNKYYLIKVIRSSDYNSVVVSLIDNLIINNEISKLMTDLDYMYIFAKSSELDTTLIEYLKQKFGENNCSIDESSANPDYSIVYISK